MSSQTVSAFWLSTIRDASDAIISSRRAKLCGINTGDAPCILGLRVSAFRRGARPSGVLCRAASETSLMRAQNQQTITVKVLSAIYIDEFPPCPYTRRHDDRRAHSVVPPPPSPLRGRRSRLIVIL